MNKIGVWTKNTLFQIINNSLKVREKERERVAIIY